LIKKPLHIFCILLGSALLFSCGDKKEHKSEVVVESVNSEDAELVEINNQIAQNPGSSNGFYRRSKYYSKIQDYNKAIDDINRALQIDPEVDFLNVEKANILMAQGRFTDAVIYAEIALDNNPQYYEAHLILGKLNYLGGDYDKAFKHLDNSLKIDKYKPEPYFIKGMVFETLKDSLKAATSYQTAIEQDANYFLAYYQLAILYLKRKPNMAIQYLESAHEIIPINMDVMRLLGTLHFEQGNYDRAYELYSKMKDADPGYVETYLYLAQTYINRLEDNASKHTKDTTLNKAISFLDKAIELYPKYTEAHYLRGACYEELGQKSKAILDYQTSLEINPQYEPSNQALRDIDK
jgi:tetratricopeptide (TPR) repeat protein